jgi:hypothetical protein
MAGFWNRVGFPFWHIERRPEAIRRLMELGLKAKPKG